MSQLSDVARTEYQRGYEQGKKDADRWISVKKELPPSSIRDNYIVTIQSWDHNMIAYEVCVDIAEYPGSYIDDMWDTDNDWIEGNEVHVTHWQPLPEPPKMDAQEGAEK